jgi:uncharacterized membrane protein YtjA (UPF0391 family)
VLRWAIAFFIVALVAAICDSGGVAAGTAGMAKILFFIFLVLFSLVLFLVALFGDEALYGKRVSAKEILEGPASPQIPAAAQVLVHELTKASPAAKSRA